VKLSIVIPAFNERHRLPPTLDAYTGYFPSELDRDFEIIIVDDGSEDDTTEIAREYAEKVPHIKALLRPFRSGKGGAVLAGFHVASGQWIGFTDADGSTPPHAFHDLLNRIGPAAAAIASRRLKESRVDPRQPFSRRALSRCFNLLVRGMFGLRITDTQCGAKLFRRDALHAVLPQIGITGYAFDVELLYALHRAGYPIVEIPTTWHNHRGSHLNVAKASVEMLLAITRLRLRYSPLRGLVTRYDRIVGRMFPKASSRAGSQGELVGVSPKTE
jgi:glycosyltransferase involved in cell wall biosynthesis